MLLMKWRTIWLMLVVCQPLWAFSQENGCRITCRFIDEETGDGIQDIRVNLGEIRNYIYVPDQEGYLICEVANAPQFIAASDQDSTFVFPFTPNDCGQMRVYSLKRTHHLMEEVKVVAFRNDRNMQSTPAPIGYIDKKIIGQTDQYSLQNALNTVSGVIMESRGYGGSHRISIRGSALRSPFAVRNIKMYADGIPLTSPDGQAPFEMMDAGDVESIEVIKGPSGSIYGSGNGGVLLFHLKKAMPNRIVVGAQTQMGSYDGYRSSEYAEIGTKTSGLRISHVWQDYAGYREQEFNKKNQVSLHFNQYISNKQKVTFYGTYYSGSWGLPGALNRAQVEEDPQQAVAFSLNNNAYLKRDRLFGGFSHHGKITAYLTETTSIYGYSTGKINPYGTSAFNSGYKDEGADGFGGRTDWTYSKRYKSNYFKFNFGGEWQTEKFNIEEKKIVVSQPGDFKYLYDIGYVTTMGFASFNYELERMLFVDLGVSYNKTEQDVRGMNADGFSFDTLATWQGTWLPRLAVSAQLSPTFHIYHSVSYGNANPTVFEMIDYENNTYNLSLKPEQGISMETGFKHQINSVGLKYELGYYEFKLNDAILAYAVSSDNDTRNFYHNAGETHQRGLEWSAQWELQKKNPWISLSISSAGSCYFYQYKYYEVNDVQWAGKNIPGVPLANAVHGLQALVFKTVSIGIQDFWFDRTPLNNANTTWAAPFHLLNVRLGYQKTIANDWEIGVYGGLNNLLNTKYTSNYNLNAAGDKYYNPSALQNWFVGLNVRYSLVR